MIELLKLLKSHAIRLNSLVPKKFVVESFIKGFTSWLVCLIIDLNTRIAERKDEISSSDEGMLFILMFVETIWIKS